jgi:hypothetical protein
MATVRSLAMQSKTKIAVCCAAALLAVGTGAYLTAPVAEQSTATKSKITNTADAVKASEMPGPDGIANKPNVINAPGKAIAPAADKQPVAPAISSPGQPSGKLTQEQLTPPAPRTEDEKLQKAAEQEYNRF